MRCWTPPRAGVAAQDGLAEIVPRPVARLVLIEVRMWVCLVRALAPRQPRPGEFTYGGGLRPLLRIVIALVVLEGAIVEVVLAAVLGPSVWVWVALGLHLYGLVWLGGFLGSLRVLPHELGVTTLVLRDSVFGTVSVPVAAIAAARAVRKAHTGRSGLTIDAAGEATLACGDTSVRLDLRPEPAVEIDGGPSPLRALHVSADDPAGLVERIARQAG